MGTERGAPASTHGPRTRVGVATAAEGLRGAVDLAPREGAGPGKQRCHAGPLVAEVDLVVGRPHPMGVLPARQLNFPGAHLVAVVEKHRAVADAHTAERPGDLVRPRIADSNHVSRPELGRRPAPFSDPICESGPCAGRRLFAVHRTPHAPRRLNAAPTSMRVVPTSLLVGAEV